MVRMLSAALVSLLLLPALALAAARTSTLSLQSSLRAAGPLETCLSNIGLAPEHVILSTDPGYPEALGQALIQDPIAAPSLFVRPESTAEVQGAVRCAAALNVTFCARSGGHSWSSSSTCRGMVVDLQRMTGFQLDQQQDFVTLGAGRTIGETFFQVHNQTTKTIPIGTCPSVGLGGFIQGGGLGPLASATGLLSDLVTQITVVMANGQKRIASTNSNRSLFWALRGGGGGYLGIVTQFKVALVPAAEFNSNVYFSFTWPSGSVAEVFHQWLKYAHANNGDTYLRISSGVLNRQRVARLMGVCWKTSSKQVCRQRLSQLALWSVQDREESFMAVAQQGVLEAQKFFTRAGRFGKEKPSLSLESTIDVFSDRFVTKRSLATQSWGSVMWDDTDRAESPTVEYFQALFDLADSETASGRAGSIGFAFYPFGQGITSAPKKFSAYPHRDRNASLAVFYSGGKSKNSRLRSKEKVQRYIGRFGGGTYLNYHDIELDNYAESYWRGSLLRMRFLKDRLDPRNLLWSSQPL